MSEIPVFSSPEEDDAAEARIDGMTLDQVRSELGTNQSAAEHLSDRERELASELTSNRATQTKLRRRAQALLRRLDQLESD